MHIRVCFVIHTFVLLFINEASILPHICKTKLAVRFILYFLSFFFLRGGGGVGWRYIYLNLTTGVFCGPHFVVIIPGRLMCRFFHSMKMRFRFIYILFKTNLTSLISQWLLIRLKDQMTWTITTESSVFVEDSNSHFSGLP